MNSMSIYFEGLFGLWFLSIPYIVLYVVGIGGLVVALRNYMKIKNSEGRVEKTKAHVLRVERRSIFKREGMAAKVSYKVDDVRYSPEQFILVPPNTAYGRTIDVWYYKDQPEKLFTTTMSDVYHGLGWFAMCVILFIMITV